MTLVSGIALAAHRGFDKRFLDRFAVVDATSGSACGRALATVPI